jgi:hypothetical protein
MSDFNPLDRAKIPTHRSSFDLSSKKLFTAKVGEILPCFWQIAIPGTKYRISSDWFTRTVPVNTAAYTRIKEYYDFYAVPLRLISRALPQAFTQMTDYMTSASSSTTNTPALTSVPNISLSIFNQFLQTANAGDQSNTRDDAGLPIVYGSCKLLDLLGYGSLIASSNVAKAAITKKYLGVDSLGDADNPLVYQNSQIVNALPFLAYQKIYYDFFSNSQWEKHKAYAYNVDYWSGTGQISLVTDMVRLRYANYPKDYFMGMLPSSQYGSVAVLPSINSSRLPNTIVSFNNDFDVSKSSVLYSIDLEINITQQLVKCDGTISSVNLGNKNRIQLLRTNFHRLIRPSTGRSQHLPTVKRSSPRLISSTSTESSMNGINIRFPLPITKVITERTGNVATWIILKIESGNTLHTKLVKCRLREIRYSSHSQLRSLSCQIPIQHRYSVINTHNNLMFSTTIISKSMSGIARYTFTSNRRLRSISIKISINYFINIDYTRPTSNIMCMITHVLGGFNTELSGHLI